MDFGQFFIKEGSTIIKSVREDNRGLTLVELIIGVTILAIIIVPLLHTFIVGASTERKSHDYGNATDAAQNLIEQIQATDADLILSNAGVVDSGATYYTSNGTTYSQIEPVIIKAPAAESGKYYIGIPNYTYADSTFDALITLDVTDPINTTDVSVSNQIGAYLNMSDADNSALLSLKAQYGGLFTNPDQALTKEQLTRSINFNITKTSGPASDTYTIDVIFSYTGQISYTTAEGKIDSVFFAHTENSSANVKSTSETNGVRPVFSVYMFFDGYYKRSIDESIIINNHTGSDINIFLVNTNTDPNSVPDAYSALIWYKYQNFVNNKPANELVFTNLPARKIIYRASRDDLIRKTLSVSGYLVELEKFERKFNVNIKLFKSGNGFSGSPILSIDSTKLN